MSHCALPKQPCIQDTYLPSAPKHLYNGRKASLGIHILIVGCGLGGLGAAHCLIQAGHKVTIIESRMTPGEAGAGIQISPNASRLLIRWGLADKLSELGVEPEGIALRRYRDGELVGYSYWGTAMRQQHGAPYYHIHRADLHRMLLDLVTQSKGARIIFNSTVESIEPHPSSNSKAYICLSNGQVIEGDLILGADGVNSIARNVVLGEQYFVKHSSNVAYRAVISSNQMQNDPELKALIDTPEVTVWMGPQQHILGYCIREKKEYNLVAIREEGNTEYHNVLEMDPGELRSAYKDFDLRVVKLLSLVKETRKLTITDCEPLERWVHPSGRLALIGDACHTMLPYRAQGASLAIEDAAVLGSLLSRLSTLPQLHYLLSAYEELRKHRATETQLSSRQNQHIFHLHDGPAQQKRDTQMRCAMMMELDRLRDMTFSEQVYAINEGNSNQWSDRKKNVEQFSYDAEAAAEDWWVKEEESLVH